MIESHQINEEIQYQLHLVAFLDILGFSEICLKSGTQLEERSLISSIYKYIDELTRNLNQISGKELIQAFSISDSIVLTLKIEGSSPTLKEIRNFVLAAGRFQKQLASNGVWIRGGVSCGLLHVNSKAKQVIGPALIHAVNLEKKSAKFPRIVADTSLISQSGHESAASFRHEINSINYKERLKPFFEWTKPTLPIKHEEPRIQQDVPLFIDFINCSIEDMSIKVATEISVGLKGPIVHYEKYRWLADYFMTTYQTSNWGLGQDREIIKFLLS